MRQQQNHDQAEIEVRARVQLLRCFFEAFAVDQMPAREFEPLVWYARKIAIIPLRSLRDAIDASDICWACEMYDAPVLGEPYDPVEAGEQAMRDAVSDCLKSLDGWLKGHDAHWFEANVDRLLGEPAREETPRAAAATSPYPAPDTTSTRAYAAFWARARVQLSRTFLLACCRGSVSQNEYEVLLVAARDSISRPRPRMIESEPPLSVPSLFCDPESQDGRTFLDQMEAGLRPLDQWIEEHDRAWSAASSGARFVERIPAED